MQIIHSVTKLSIGNLHFAENSLESKRMSALTLKDWFFNAHLDFQKKEGRKYTDDEFAEVLGISRSYLTQLKGGKKETISKNVADRAYLVTGDISIYDVAKLERPNWAVIEIQRAMEEATLEAKKELNRRLEETLRNWAKETLWEIREIE